VGDSEQKLVTVKLRLEQREWLKDEIHKIRKEEGREPIHAEVFDRMRQSYEDRLKHLHSETKYVTSNKSQNTVQVSEDEFQPIERLIAILRSRNAVAIKAVLSSLECFDDYWRVKSQSQPKAHVDET